MPNECSPSVAGNNRTTADGPLEGDLRYLGAKHPADLLRRWIRNLCPWCQQCLRLWLARKPLEEHHHQQTLGYDGAPGERWIQSLVCAGSGGWRGKCSGSQKGGSNRAQYFRHASQSALSLRQLRGGCGKPPGTSRQHGRRWESCPRL